MLANITKLGRVSRWLECHFHEMGAQVTLGRAVTALEKVAPLAAGQLDQALESLLRADAELGEAGSAISRCLDTLEAQPEKLQQLDERLHELPSKPANTAVARMNCHSFIKDLADRLAAIEDSSGSLGQLREGCQKMARLLS